MKFIWEILSAFDKDDLFIRSCRAKVFNGWIVRYSHRSDDLLTSSMVFVPDPNHDWVIDE